MRRMLCAFVLALTAVPLAAHADTVLRAETDAIAALGGAADLARPELPAMASPLAVRLPEADAARDLTEGGGGASALFTTERAKILLRSLTLPGWGQATLGHTTAAWVFGLAETAIWGSFAAFKFQEGMRRETYERTAGLFAGIDLEGRDEEFRRIVGSYLSSEEYNRLVVFRDAANLYYDDPAAYRQYIAENELKGEDGWNWVSVDDIERYRDERQMEQRAANRANTTLALAIANRILSAMHAARVAGQTPPTASSWNIECVPGAEPTDFRLGVRTRF
jgi:hypothetical protein